MMVNQTVPQAWTEVCHQSFGGLFVQTVLNLQKNLRWRGRDFSQEIFTNGLNMDLLQWAQVEKIVHGVEMHRLPGKEKISGTAVSKGDADNVLGYKRTHDYWFPLNLCNCKQYLILPTP